MKKIIILIISLFIAGCVDLTNTPIRKVEELFHKYQTLDSSLINNLDYYVEMNNYTKKQKDEYRSIMKRQYRDLTYVIKEEETEGDNSTVKVEIEVYDYNKAIEESNNFFIHNQEYFLVDGLVDNTKFLDYKLALMSETNERVKYSLEFHLKKEDGIWILKDINEDDRLKIHGVYTY